MFGDFLEEFSHRDLLAGDVDPRRREILLQNRRDGRREVVDMRQRPRLVQIAVEHQCLALPRQRKAFVDMAGMRREGVRLAVQLPVAEDMRRDGVPADAAPCLQQHLRLHDGGVAQAVRVDFGILADAAAVGVADVRGGEIDEMDLSIHRMDGGQMFAKGLKRPDMQVAVRRHVVAEEDQIAFRGEVEMTVICFTAGRRFPRPVGGHRVADGGHRLGQTGSDEGVRADDDDLLRPSLIPEDRLLFGLQIYDRQPLTIHNA